LTCPGWLAALARATRVLACPLVPAAWFARDARRSAEAVIQLDRVTRKYRRVRDGLPEFAPEALREADPATLATPRGDPARLLPRPDDTLRARCRRLARAGDALRELLRRTTATDQALQQAITLLQVPLPPLAVRGLRRFADLSEHAARMRPVRRSWWDPARR